MTWLSLYGHGGTSHECYLFGKYDRSDSDVDGKSGIAMSDIN